MATITISEHNKVLKKTEISDNHPKIIAIKKYFEEKQAYYESRKNGTSLPKDENTVDVLQLLFTK